ncbi:MAG: ABC transporter [Planctomycetes bacterium]|jgi:oligopeptide transport system permease protein|nr:ABC transporter [Planctomycetota bacterium]MDP6423729.1 ABC transporter permease [Planctomycetota bacterium]
MRDVLRFLTLRFLWLLATLWVVFTLSFVLMREVPGGPFLMEQQVDPVIQKQIEAAYDLDKTKWEQYVITLGKTVRGDLGPSFKMRDYTVNEILAEGMPRSVALGTLALLIALVLGIVAGTVSASRRGGFIDRGLMLVATIGIALPNFVIASILILVFVIQLSWLPAAGWGSLRFMILPAFCLGAPFAAYIARLTRTGMLETLTQDYVRTAHAKGLSPWRVVTGHAMKGGLLPVASFLGPAVAGILTGSLVIEKIFAIPGLGTYFVQAALNRDYTLAMGCVLFYTLLVYVMNLLVDISYTILDPRVRLD